MYDTRDCTKLSTAAVIVGVAYLHKAFTFVEIATLAPYYYYYYYVLCMLIFWGHAECINIPIIA